jgi:drug/metabolite transporter (DMT)-like permease
MGKRGLLIAVLVVMGAGWGLGMPLTKIAVSEGYRHIGLIFWQLVIQAAMLGAIVALRGRGLPLGWQALRWYLVIALLGTLLPNAASYQAAVFLPAGVVAVLISMVPIFAFPIALAMGNEGFGWLRLGGLACGLAGVLLLAGPEASLPERAMVWFIPLALIAPALYALEGNVVAKWGTGGADPIQLLCGAALVGLPLAGGMALATGHWIDPRPPWGAPDAALVANSAIHAVVYTAYVWVVARAGAVFAAQVSYLVTGFGVLWSMALLAERYSGWVWLALALMFAGLFLVQPRGRVSVAHAGKARQDAVE